MFVITLYTPRKYTHKNWKLRSYFGNFEMNAIGPRLGSFSCLDKFKSNQVITAPLLSGKQRECHRSLEMTI